MDIVEDEATHVDFTLDPAVLHPVSGRVTDDSGMPVAGALVTIEGIGAPFDSATTDVDGAYLHTLPEGSYRATFSAGGCLADVSAELVVDGPETLDVQLDRRRDTHGHACALEASDYIEATDPLALSGDDASTSMEPPFAFPYYGPAYTMVHVATNGFLSFTLPDATSSNSSIPSATPPNAAVYPFLG